MQTKWGVIGLVALLACGGNGSSGGAVKYSVQTVDNYVLFCQAGGPGRQEACMCVLDEAQERGISEDEFGKFLSGEVTPDMKEIAKQCFE